MYICIYANIYVHIYTYTPIHIYTCTHMYDVMLYYVISVYFMKLVITCYTLVISVTCATIATIYCYNNSITNNYYHAHWSRRTQGGPEKWGSSNLHSLVKTMFWPRCGLQLPLALRCGFRLAYSRQFREPPLGHVGVVWGWKPSFRL